jgi:hypothetical protein
MEKLKEKKKTLKPKKKEIGPKNGQISRLNSLPTLLDVSTLTHFVSNKYTKKTKRKSMSNSGVLARHMPLVDVVRSRRKKRVYFLIIYLWYKIGKSPEKTN